ncbi:hypothetical protein M1N85_04950 [Dehalococcoidia bacterium]|nr:hypothetical protein [Dehalococcoidia bacterium]
MLKRYVSQMHNEQKGITGLETAIILIAFVVVASVFAYTVLTAGIFAAERGEEAVHAGLEGARASIVTVGGIIASGNTTPPDNVAAHHVTGLTFTLTNAVGGEPINFTVPTGNITEGVAAADATNVVVISYVDQHQHVSDLLWSRTPLGEDDGDYLLEPGEKFQITITNLRAGADGPLTTALGTDHMFTIEIKPPVGAVLTLERTTPAVIDPIMNLN